MTLTQTLAKSLGWAMSLFVVLALTMAYVWYVDTANMERGSSSDVMEIRPHAKGTVGYVIDKSKCVKHESSKVYPTGVVFQDPTGRAHFSRDTVVIGKALSEEIDGIEWKNSTNMFCK